MSHRKAISSLCFKGCSSVSTGILSQKLKDVSFFHGYLLGKIAFSFCCVILHCSYILWRHYLTNGASEGDSVNLHMLFWLIFSEISIMFILLPTGIISLSSPGSPRSGVRCLLTPVGSVSACVRYWCAQVGFGYRIAGFGLACDDRNFSHCGCTLFCDSVAWTLQWSVLSLPVQQLIPVGAPVFPGREEGGECLSC